MATSDMTVAVIGLGSAGLVTLKNLLEEGFNATGFDSNGYVGGLWKYSSENKTSVTQGTIANISKERGCFTDFPFPKDIPSHPNAVEVDKYLQDYAEHFNLGPHLRLNTRIRDIFRNDQQDKWVIDIGSAKQEYFDKLVICTGLQQTPCIPHVPGMDRFEGTCIHSREHKRPEDFSGKRVLVVGLGNSGSDTSTELIGHANKIYLAHNHGSLIIPRVTDGKPIDHVMNYRIQTIQDILTNTFPNLATKMLDTMVERVQNKSFTMKPEWGMSPAPSLEHARPTVTDTLIPALERGEVQSVQGLSSILDGTTVLLTDGTKLSVDAIIFCTGYKWSFSILPREFDPTVSTATRWAAVSGSKENPLASLYQNMFSLARPDALAFVGFSAFSSAAFQSYDLASMAITQVWKGASNLPPPDEMAKEVSAQHEWLCDLATRGSVVIGTTKLGPWMEWVNNAAGTGVNEYLGYGWKGWAFWWRQTRFCNLLMGGLFSPHVYRVFEGKRKKWDGAKEAIESVNEEARKTKPKQS